MKLTPEQIRAAIEAREILAVALDTSIFSRKRYELETGVLPRLEQFKESNIFVLIPDVVHQEVTKHIRQLAEEALSKASIAVNSMGRSWNQEKTVLDTAIASIANGKTPKEISDDRVNRYLTLIGATVLDSSDVNGPMLLSRYFEGKPPFENEGYIEPEGNQPGRARNNKKYEFPDAIALLSIEKWAKEKKCKVLTLSADNGWTKFCDESDHLVGMSDLAKALALFQSEADAHRARLIFRSIAKGDPHGILKRIAADVSEQSWKMSFDVDASSAFEFEDDVHDVRLKGISAESLQQDGAFDLIESSNDSFVAAATVPATFLVGISFSFSKWDREDREYMPLGDCSLTREEDVDVNLTVEVLLDGKNLSIETVDVAAQTNTIELGDVEPDWMGDPENFQ